MAPSMLERGLLTVLSGLGPSTTSEITSAVRGDVAVVRRMLRSLERQELVERMGGHGQAWWRLAPSVDPETLPTLIIVSGPGAADLLAEMGPCTAVLAETGEVCALPAVGPLCLDHDPAWKAVER